jgi:hypothetical protein
VPKSACAVPKPIAIITPTAHITLFRMSHPFAADGIPRCQMLTFSLLTRAIVYYRLHAFRQSICPIYLPIKVRWARFVREKK